MSNIEKSGGGPLPENHTAINPATGQQKAYVVLTPEERAKGFVEPVREHYVHLKCGTLTTMGRDIAETYARDPEFYNGTFCAGCRTHFPLIEFVWEGTQQTVGTRSPPAASGNTATARSDKPVVCPICARDTPHFHTERECAELATGTGAPLLSDEQIDKLIRGSDPIGLLVIQPYLREVIRAVIAAHQQPK